MKCLQNSFLLLGIISNCKTMSAKSVLKRNHYLRLLSVHYTKIYNKTKLLTVITQLLPESVERADDSSIIHFVEIENGSRELFCLLSLFESVY